MKLNVLIFCSFVMMFSGGVPALAAPDSSKFIDRNDAKRILQLNVSGIHLKMSIGEVKSILESRGYTVRCTLSSCQVREGMVSFRFSYPRKKYDKTPFTPSREITYFAHTRGGPDPAGCGDILKAIEMFCVDGEDEFPCTKHNSGLRVDVMPRGHADDGWRYSMSAGISLPIQCSIKLQRHQKKS